MPPLTEVPRLVVIGASAGGVAALRALLARLSPDLNAAVAIVLHIGPDHADGLVHLFNSVSALPVEEAASGMPLRVGHVYMAPGGYHLLIEKNGRLALSVDEKVCFVRPSADVLFSSAADAWGAATIGVILTGTNNDGARGLAEVRACGGLALVQLPEEAEEPAMPQAALHLSGADAVLAVSDIAERINQACKQ